MKFSYSEIRDLVFAWLLISLAFAILFAGGILEIFSGLFLITFAVSLITAGIGFLLHELMHKFVAQKYGLFAEFQAFYKMIFLAIGLAFFGFIFAAPGAVMIRGRLTPEKNGKISLAGPLTNIVLAVLFLIPLRFYSLSGIAEMIFSLGFRINALLALFNMIPIMPLDGAKVLAWSKKAFYAAATVSLALFLISFAF